MNICQNFEVNKRFNTDFYSPGQGLQPNSFLKHNKTNVNLFKKNQEWIKLFYVSDKAKIPIFY